MQSQSKVYKVTYTSLKEIAEGSVNLNDIINDHVHGFVVNDFLTLEEVNKVINGFRTISDSDLIHIEKDFDSYPMSFAQYDQLLQRGLLSDEDYFSKSEEFIDSFTQKFGIDILAKLRSLFNQINNSTVIEIPQKPETGRFYVPFTFRELFPGDGCLKAHCENLFYQEFPGFFEKISAFSTAEHQLSFFVVLQKPRSGGELTLFDILWNEEQKRLGDSRIKLQDNSTYEFDNAEKLRRDYHSPCVGSLVIFSGGKIWHRVENVKEAPSRITLGGFLSFSHDKSKLFSWS